MEFSPLKLRTRILNHWQELLPSPVVQLPLQPLYFCLLNEVQLNNSILKISCSITQKLIYFQVRRTLLEHFIVGCKN